MIPRANLLRTQCCLGRVGFEVAIEPGGASSLPVGGVVLGGSGAVAQGAEEGVAPGIDNNADVSWPNYEVTGLRVMHSSKVVIATIEIGRGSVGIGEAGAIINGMDQVGAVDARSPVQIGVEGGGNDGGAFMACQ